MPHKASVVTKMYVCLHENATEDASIIIDTDYASG